jgi:hypothetical protein
MLIAPSGGRVVEFKFYYSPKKKVAPADDPGDTSILDSPLADTGYQENEEIG